MNDLLDAYPIIEKLLPWVGGAIGGSLLTVIRNRRALLTYNVSHQKIGMTADDEIHGKVEVTYRGSVVHNLYLSVVTIKNHSFRDLEDLDLKTFRGGNDISLLTEQTHIEGTIEIVDLTKEYMDRIGKDSDWEKEISEAGTQDEDANKKRIDADASFRHGQRHYTVPVLNRGQNHTVDLSSGRRTRHKPDYQCDDADQRRTHQREALSTGDLPSMGECQSFTPLKSVSLPESSSLVW